MPITRRQFELGIDSAIEEWMEKLYDFLKEHKSEAYTLNDLVEDEADRSVMQDALYALARVHAVESRYVGGESYSAFSSTVRKGIWEPNVRV